MSRRRDIILVVDDEGKDLRLMADALAEQGYSVLKATSYDSAMSVFEQQDAPITLLVSDISLPGKNGCELAKAILKRDPGIKVLFVSGHVGAEVCKFYGIPVSDLHFLRKPFEPAGLAVRVEEVLRSPETVQTLVANGTPAKRSAGDDSQARR